MDPGHPPPDEPDPDPPPQPTLPPTLPTLPPTLPPTVPTPQPGIGAPQDPPPVVGTGPATGEMLPADAVATRNVPHGGVVRDLGLPKAEGAERRPFVRPDLEPMGEATVALLVGRTLFAIAALLVGLAARRASGGQSQADGFWPVAICAGVLTLVGVAGLVFWSATLADNARRLRARSATARGMVWAWALPVAWVAISCGTYLQIEVDGELDPFPAVAALGWLLALAIAYGRLQGVFRGLSRNPPILWVTVFPLDLAAFGLVWWRLTDWPTPVGDELDHIRLTSNIAFGAAAALAANAVLFGWLAQKGSNGVFERLGRLEAQHRPPGSEPNPEWFHAGVASRPAGAVAAPTATRPLIATRHLSTAVSVLHVAWGLATIAFGIVVAVLAFEYSDLPVFVDDDLVVAAADTDRVALVGGITGAAYVAAVIGHGIWAVLSATNGRRVTVHSPNPGTFAVAFAPMPVLGIAGLIIGGTLGYWLVVIGLSIAFFALVLVNQMLMALSARLGGSQQGFSRWSGCLALTYLAGVVLNVLFSSAQAQLGLYATLSLVQGALIAAGGVIGHGAMHELDRTIREHRQTRRAAA